MASGRKCTSRPAVKSSQSCSANFYSCIKRRVGHSLRGTHYNLILVPSRKQVAHKLSGTKGGLLGPKRVLRPLLEPNISHSYRRHHSGHLHKRGRRHKVKRTVRPSAEDPYLVFQKTGYSQGQTHSRPAACGSKQAVMTRPDHPDRVVSPSRGLAVDMQQVAPTSDLFATKFNNNLGQFVSLVPDP